MCAGARARRVRHRCEQMVGELGLPDRTDLTGVCGAVAAYLGCSVRIMPMRLDGAASGMTARTDDGYWIFCELRTSAWHRTHIVTHEIGRLLLEHAAPGVTDRDGPAPRAVEVLGGLLMARVAPSPVDRGPEPTGPAAELAAALAPALRHRRDGPLRAAGRGGGNGGKDGAACGAGDSDGGSSV
ncbi:hypothetical protein ADK86_26100 [Streptomyces sp. NRRL F-5755]|nr:hypothetical protein ADK86_26100 [Streptomyces sp. NRRL F-5755]